MNFLTTLCRRPFSTIRETLVAHVVHCRTPSEIAIRWQTLAAQTPCDACAAVLRRGARELSEATARVSLDGQCFRTKE